MRTSVRSGAEIIRGLLDPLQAQLNDLEEFADAWERNLVNPVQAAITQRDTIRSRIASYRELNGLNVR